jgi:transcriptional regulator with XRE-family HTH domain
VTKREWKHDRPTKKLVADQLRAFVLRHGITQVAIAKIIGCHSTAVSQALNGKFGSFELYDHICWALGLSLSDLNTRPREKHNVVSIHRAKLRAAA